MGMYGVGEEKEKGLEARMQKLGIRAEDLTESFVRSGGSGGQNVNKVSTCVQLRHLPTGLEVKCQRERSQAMNRYYARKILTDKIEALIFGAASAEQQRIEKMRRQKRKRSRRAKERILEAKHQQSEKKRNRRSSGADE